MGKTTVKWGKKVKCNLTIHFTSCFIVLFFKACFTKIHKKSQNFRFQESVPFWLIVRFTQHFKKHFISCSCQS